MKQMASDRAQSDCARMTVSRYASAAEASSHDIEFWRQLSAGERILQVWRLSQEQWILAGHTPHEPRLSRSLQFIAADFIAADPIAEITEQDFAQPGIT